MKIISNKKELRRNIHLEQNLGFVPTMGSIHSGHISLIKKSMSQCNKTIVSIFINKSQFNRKSDFQKYPRNIKKDISILKRLNFNYLYIPTNNQIHPNGSRKNIRISSFSKELCGKFRPGHFKAVVDVIDKFINIIIPKKIYLGKKDMQQLKIVEDFVKNKYPQIKVIGCNTIREKNGIPYSSRNSLLSLNEIKIASNIFKFIKKNKKKIINKRISIKQIKEKIYINGVSKIDYVKILDINKINKPIIKNKKYQIFLAYYLGKVRLIDNI